VTLQDGLLSFTIKETIFLSSDKAGIEELKELELIPDVEIIENAAEISITGCLQLHGKYEPARSTLEPGGADTLVEAMKFTPFQLQQAGGGLYGTEEQLSHRIPLNITIPTQRVAELTDIYAIVDSFDYHMASPQQLVIEAELKIAGIALADQQEQEKQAEEWEFVHTSHDQNEQAFEPSTLDDIERKLAELEREMELQAERQNASPFAAMFELPQAGPARFPEKEQEMNWQGFGDVSYEEQPAFTERQEEDTPLEAMYELEQVKARAEEEPDQEMAEHRLAENSVEHLAKEVSAEVETTGDEAYPTEFEQEEVQDSQPADETKEMRVAISSKPSKEEGQKLNLTSIFSQARRVQEAQAAEVHESSSSSSRRAALPEADSVTLEAVHNLTSFVRNKEERYSTLKLCIIQQDDTLESISQKYSLPVSRIVEVNKLTSDRLTEGQILYIPQ
jgi:stage VI sporulation protein D